jgi:hypothetical protein
VSDNYFEVKMSKDISSAIGGVMRVAAGNPALWVAVATGRAILMLGSSLAYTLAKHGKNVKFSIGDLMVVEAEFCPPD